MSGVTNVPQAGPMTWADHNGRVWPEVRSTARLKFKYPLHAALRAFVFHRDGYACRRCGTPAIDVPFDYDGRRALWTARVDGGGWQVVMVLDHILTLKAGGRSVISNLQTLCEQCNKSKQREDRAATLSYNAERL